MSIDFLPYHQQSASMLLAAPTGDCMPTMKFLLLVSLCTDHGFMHILTSM